MKGWSEIVPIRAVLLDFDGPICGVFSDHPAPLVADELRVGLLKHGIDISPEASAMDDPLAVLRWTGERHPEVTDEIDAILVAAERKAVRSAQPTPHVHRVLASAQRAKCPVAIVSNNSPAAVTDYLRQHGILKNVAAVAARPFGTPSAMKPSPTLVLQATRRLGVAPDGCVFVGDATTDIEAGRAAGVRVIGYAKTPRHGAALAYAAPDGLINSMRDLADALDECADSGE